jgi:hypothetical protein
VKRISFVVVVLLSSWLLSQEPKLPHVSVSEVPPEPFPAGTCKESYSGYLEVKEHGKSKDANLSGQQIGDYVKRRLGEGYSLALYPQASGRLFVIETCLAKN